MEYPTEDHQTFIVVPHSFSAMRAYEDAENLTHLTATTMSLKFSCSPLGDSVEEGTKAMVGYQRLRTWLEAVITQIIFIDVSSPMLPAMQHNITNMLMYVPGGTDDAMLAALFYAKARAITKDMMQIHSIWISSTDTENTERYYRCIDAPNGLPGIEYYTDGLEDDEGEKYVVTNPEPWWDRPTIDICEYIQSEDEDVVWFEVDPLQEIGKEYLTSDKEADIIVFDSWKGDKE